MNQTLDRTFWRNEKILTLGQARDLSARLKQQGKKIVTVNGSFDLLHIGHVDQLEQAKRQGNVLFVGINSDISITENKGKDRPIINEQIRAAMLAALICVDYVTIVDAPYHEMQNVFLRAVQPHVHANGPDYGKPETWIERPVMQEIGAVGFSAQKCNDFSTTNLLKKIAGK